MEIPADSDRVRALDMVEINPILDQRNQTAAVRQADSLIEDRQSPHRTPCVSTVSHP